MISQQTTPCLSVCMHPSTHTHIHTHAYTHNANKQVLGQSVRGMVLPLFRASYEQVRVVCVLTCVRLYVRLGGCVCVCLPCFTFAKVCDNTVTNPPTHPDTYSHTSTHHLAPVSTIQQREEDRLPAPHNREALESGDHSQLQAALTRYMIMGRGCRPNFLLR